MWLWRLRCLTFGHQHAREPGKPVTEFNPSPKAWEPGVDGVSPGVWRPKNQAFWCQKAGEYERSSSKRKREFTPSSAFLFYLGPSRNWRMPTHIGEGRSFVFSLSIQMLISSRNTLKVTHRNNVLPTIWTSLSPATLTHKTNHHRPRVCVPPKVICWNPNPQCDGIWRWNFWEVIVMRVEISWRDWCPYKKRRMRACFLLCHPPCKDTTWRPSSVNQEENRHQEPSHADTLVSDF